MDKIKQIPNWLLDNWKKYQCADCQGGSREKCSATRKNAKAVRIDETGKYHYYCFIGCMLLELEDSESIKFINSQFDVDGHYEQSFNHMFKNSELVKASNQ